MRRILVLGLPMLRRLLGLGLAFIAAVVLGGCSLDSLRTVNAQVPQLVISELGDPKTFNTVLSQEATSIFDFIYEGLTAQNYVTGELEPAIAESWEVSPDQLRYVFTLRPDLKWSDGHPLTAEDVDFTYNKVIYNEAIPTGYRDILKIGESGALPKVRALDDRRVEFVLPEPFAPFLRTVGLVLPAHVMREAVETKNSDGQLNFLNLWGTNVNPRTVIGNGPYQLVDYDTSQRVVFERNPYYWRKDKQGNAMPFVERLVIRLIESTDTSFLQFRSGSLDILGVNPQIFSLLKREEKRGHFTIYQGGPAAGTSFISFNLNLGKNSKGQPLVDPIKSRWFNTKEFRQAVAYGIDRKKMVNNVFQGLGQPQNSPISVQSPYYLKPEEGLKVYDYNPDKAKEILLGAGFKYDDRGQLLDRDGNRVRFTLITNAENKLRISMGAQVKQDLAKLGIQVDFNPINFNTLVGKLSDTRDWECYLLGLTGGIEPNNGANVWRSNGNLHSFNQGPTAGQPPLQGWQVADWEKEIDRLYILGARETDDAKRKAIYAKTQQITQEQLPVIYLVNPIAMSAVRNRVQGVKFSALGGTLWNVQELKVLE